MLETAALSLIVRAGAGVNTIDVTAASRRGIYVSNCPGKNAIAVAELAFGLILALDRRIPDNVADLRAGKWNKKEYSKAKGLFGRTLGILGFGSIGQEVARRAQAFGMPVLVWSRRFSRDPAAAVAEMPDDLDITIVKAPEDVAAGSDVLSVHLALANDTRQFVGASILNRLTPGIVLRQHVARRDRGPRGARWRRPKPRRSRGAGCVRAGARGGDRRVQRSVNRAAERDWHASHRRLDRASAGSDRRGRPSASSARSKKPARFPNVVNLATKTPATHMLVVRHRDRPGVLAHVFDHLRAGNLNVQETENIIFEGAEAAIARINLDGNPPAASPENNRGREPGHFELERR